LFAWIEGRPLTPKRDAFMIVVAAVFSAACLALIAASVVILSRWSDISRLQHGYDILSFTAGTMLRIGIPLMLVFAAATLYYSFRRDRKGVFLSLAVLCPILTGAVLSLMGMDVSPIYVLYVTFPACVLASYFLVELFQIAGCSSGGNRLYVVATVTAATAILTFGDLPGLVSYYIDGNRSDVPSAMNWIEKERAGKGAIVIAGGIAYPRDYYQRKGIPFESLPLDASVESVMELVLKGKVVVMSYGWWMALPREGFARIGDVPHWLLVGAERDGLTPNVSSDEFRIYSRDERGPTRTLKASVRPSEVLRERYQKA
jgi:hypothetical protein